MRELLRPLLVECGHIMDLCQLDILCAIGYFEDNQHKKAFELLHKVLKICKKRRFDRLLADEGIKIYTLIMAYKIEEHIQDEYVEHIITLSKKSLSFIQDTCIGELRKYLRSPLLRTTLSSSCVTENPTQILRIF